jgi:flagellar FliJ protein
MARFVFELEVVLEQRTRVEESKQRALAELERARVTIMDRARQIQESMSAGRNDLRSRLTPGPVAIASVRLQTGSAMHSVIQLQRLAIELAGVHKRIDAARAELLAATVARKAVQALKDRRYAAWKREQDRKENAMLDDLSVMRFGRNEQIEGVAS